MTMLTLVMKVTIAWNLLQDLINFSFYPTLSQCSISVSDCKATWTHNHLVCKRTLPFSQTRPVWLNGWVFVYKLSGYGFESPCNRLNFRCRPYFEATVECGFTLTPVRDMIRTCSQSISIPPENVRKPHGFQTFSGCIEMDHSLKMG